MGQVSHEPSMEDILASIKRIIAEDSEAVGARPARLRREAISAVQASPMIVRTPDPEVEPEGLPEDQPEAAVESHASQQQDWTPEARSDEAPAEDARIEAARTHEESSGQGEADPAVAAAPPEEHARAPEDVLELTSTMSDAKSDAQENDDMPATKPAAPSGTNVTGLVSGQTATASRNAFAAITQLQVRDEEGKSNTLEGLVGDLLRPMLREWLDRELPPLVERVVTAEVRRLSGGVA